jgi:hypothetical protein
MTIDTDERPRRLTHSQIIDELIGALAKGSGDHSTVALNRNAKGDTQISVSVRTGEGDITTADEAAAKAAELYDGLAALTTVSGDRSTVKLTRNAKGDTQIEVAVESADDAETKARELYDSLATQYPIGGSDG